MPALSSVIRATPTPDGDFLDENGNVIGRHKGRYILHDRTEERNRYRIW